MPPLPPEGRPPADAQPMARPPGMHQPRAHPLAALITEAAAGRYPAADGGWRRVPPWRPGLEGIVAFTGHAVLAVAPDICDARIIELGANGFGGAHDPRLVAALAGPDGWIDILDVLLAGHGTGEAGGTDAAGFMAALDPVNAAAEQAPGFIWRLQTEDGNATAIRAFEWDAAGSAGVIVNMSVWTSAVRLRQDAPPDHAPAPGMVLSDARGVPGVLVGPGRASPWHRRGRGPDPLPARARPDAACLQPAGQLPAARRRGRQGGRRRG